MTRSFFFCLIFLLATNLFVQAINLRASFPLSKDGLKIGLYSSIALLKNVTSLEAEILDDASEPYKALRNVIIKEVNYSIVIGSYYSYVSAGIYHYLRSMGIPGISVSNAVALVDKSVYSTLVTMTPFSHFEAEGTGALAALIHKIGWKNLAVISSEDTYSQQQTAQLLNQANVLGFRIAEKIYFFGGSELNYRKFLFNQLSYLKSKNIKIFYLACLSLYVPVVLEEAYKLGMVGNKDHAWVIDSDLEDLLETWKFLKENPIVGQGLITIGYACDTKTTEYRNFVESARKVNASYEAEYLGCVAYDSVLVAVRSYMAAAQELRQRGIEENCLNPNDYKISQHCERYNNEVKELLMDKNNCHRPGDERPHTGVCYAIEFFENLAIPSNFYNILLLDKIYELDFTGSTGQIKFDRHGGRSEEGYKIYYKNILFQNKPSPSFRTQVFGEFSFVDKKLSFENYTRIFFPGNSLTKLNYEPTIDTIVRETFSRTFRVVMIGVTSVIMLFYLASMGTLAYLHKHHSESIESSYPFMMYLMITGAMWQLISLWMPLFASTLSEERCIWTNWLYNIGWVLVVAPLYIRIYRVNYLKQKRILLDLAVLCAALIIMSSYLIYWTVSEKESSALFLLPNSLSGGDEYETRCVRSFRFYIVEVVQAIVSFLGIFLLQLAKDHEEEKVISIVLYNSAVFSFFSATFLYFSSLPGSTTFVIREIIHLEQLLFLLGALIVYEHFYKILFRGEKDLEDDSDPLETSFALSSKHTVS